MAEKTSGRLAFALACGGVGLFAGLIGGLLAGWVIGLIMHWIGNNMVVSPQVYYWGDEAPLTSMYVGLLAAPLGAAIGGALRSWRIGMGGGLAAGAMIAALICAGGRYPIQAAFAMSGGSVAASFSGMIAGWIGRSRQA